MHIKETICLNMALSVNTSKLNSNLTQIAGAQLVLNILREPILHYEDREQILRMWGGDVLLWWKHVWQPLARRDDSFYAKMEECIQNCQRKLEIERFYDDDVEKPDDFTFDDLFKLLMGTVNIPLSQETARLIRADDRVLTEYSDIKDKLQHDQTWIGILRRIASICADREGVTQTVCSSIEFVVFHYTDTHI
jgi:hypothetical protein